MILGAPAAEIAAKPQHYMALLPMKVVGDDALKYIAEGVDDAITAKLAGLKKVYVAPASAVATMDAKQEPQKIARALGVTILAQGTAQGSGDTMSISITMNDVVNNKALLVREFKGSKKDLLTLEDQIFGQLVNALVIQQTNEERLRTTARPTENVDAYDLYLKGRNLLRGRQQDAGNLEQALAIFNQAVERDPKFAIAYTGIADASLAMFNVTKDAKWTQQAISAAQQAQGLDDKLPEAHLSLGTAYTLLGQTGQATAELKIARELAPNSDAGLRRLARAYQADGRQQEALRAFLDATEVNPYLWTNFDALGTAYFRYGENEKAREAYHKVTMLAPESARGWSGEGAAYYRIGKINEAIPRIQKAIELDPIPGYYNQLGVALFFLGRYPEAAGMFETAVQKQPDNSLFLVSLADAYRWSNQPEKAAKAYDQAITKAFKAIEVNPKNIRALGALSVSYAKKGDYASAAKFIQQARQIDREDNDLMYREATIHFLASRVPEALKSLGEALRNGYSLQEAKSDPELKGLRERPEFQKLEQQAVPNVTK
jgi:tetratricopeptide (TPR) repeat protein/TolB-like protein